MLKKLVVALVVLAVAVPALASVNSRDGIVPSNHETNAVTPVLGDRADVEFNTGGAYNTTPDAVGSASGWAYYSAHMYTNGGPDALDLVELGFPTCPYTTDPIALPVEWFVLFGATGNIAADIPDPYTAAYTFSGTFTPSNATDSGDINSGGDPSNLVYDAIDLTGMGAQLAAGDAMWWGYENAGLQGMLAAVVEQTFGWYVSFWDDDTLYGRTALMQFMGNYATTATEESTLSQIKSLY